MSQLHEAIRNNEIERIKELIINGENINEVDSMLRTPLHLASWKGSKEIIEILLNYKAKTILKAKDNYNSLHFAIQSNSLECCKLLIQYDKSLLNTRISKGNKTALHLAASKNNYEIVEYLLEAGADPTALTNKKQTALDFTNDSRIFELIKHKIEMKIEEDVKRAKKRSINELNDNQNINTHDLSHSNTTTTITSSSSLSLLSSSTTTGITPQTNLIMIPASELEDDDNNNNDSIPLLTTTTSTSTLTIPTIPTTTTTTSTTNTTTDISQNNENEEQKTNEIKIEKIVKIDLSQRKKKKPKVGIYLSHLEDD